MKKNSKNNINYPVIIFNLFMILVVNLSLFSLFLEYERENQLFFLDNFITFKQFIFGGINISLIILMYFLYKSNKKREKNFREMMEKEELKRTKSLLNKDNYIKKYLSNEKYKEFQETLNDIPEDEKDDFKDLVFSELLKKQAEKYIKGGNDN